MTNSIPVQVDLTITGMDAIRATGLVIGYIDQGVLATMPLPPSDTADIICTNLGYVTAKNWQTEAQKHGQVLDPHTFLAFLKTLPEDDTNFYCTQWELDEGGFGCVASGVWGGCRKVRVRRRDDDWRGSWVAPVSKPSELGA